MELEECFGKVEYSLLKDLKTKEKNYELLEYEYKRLEKDYEKIRDKYLDLQARFNELLKEKEKLIIENAGGNIAEEKEIIEIVFKSTNWFNLDKKVEVLERKIKFDCLDKHTYISYLEKNINFNIAPENNILKHINTSKRYKIAFKGKRVGNVDAELFIVTYKSGQKLDVKSIKLNREINVDFNKADNIRLAIRLKGKGELVIDSIVIREVSKFNQYEFCFYYEGKRVQFYLPDYKTDYIQKTIANSYMFYEEQMLQDIKNKLPKNSVVIDVGANIGNHSLYLALIVGAKKVYAFEPQKHVFDILEKNVQINQLDKVIEMYNVAVGNSKGKVNVNRVDINNLGASRVELSRDGEIEIDSLDNLLFNKLKKLDLIKIDTEGFEEYVIKGAMQLITKFKPYIYVEAGTKEDYHKISNLMYSLNYKVEKKFNATPTYLFVHK
ncbi:FkbM family methyltransferase [Caloranaerobacter ferrireducens]|uniref:FkbM family methyltransferase n=1 Tax=Caloranaerobacter ferrireducens TaxID=1323370 RepID=UPI00084D9BC1|nr:FkbM family methyltransferase [Caloranaerobacter ferrireducens]